MCTRLQVLEAREIQPLQQYNSPPKYIGDIAPTEGQKGEKNVKQTEKKADNDRIVKRERNSMPVT